MSQIHIAGANGFPANTYKHLFDSLDQHTITYLNLLGHPYSDGYFSWESMIDEIISNIEATATEPVIGFGHSMGAVCTYLASLKRPDLFSRLILVEPVIFRPAVRKLIGLKRMVIKNQHSGKLAAQALKRKEKFLSREEAHEYFSGKNLFKYFTEKSLDAYLEHGLTQHDSGFQLTFDKRIESRVFATVPVKIPASTHQLPINILFGEKTNLLNIFDMAYWKNNFGKESMIFHPGSHLFPFEEPDIFLGLVNAIIDQDTAAIKAHNTAYPYIKRPF